MHVYLASTGCWKYDMLRCLKPKRKHESVLGRSERKVQVDELLSERERERERDCNDEWIAKEEDLRIFLAGSRGRYDMIQEIPKIDSSQLCILESFYDIPKEVSEFIPHVKSFMLDSGAFSFLVGKGKNLDFEDYTMQYGEYVKKHHPSYFFELDIDSVVGYDKVLKYRKILEDITNRQPIPVWHKSRGKSEYLKSISEYPYVALGGIVSKEWSKDEYRFFPYFINEAHKRGVKIHGLGFTQLEGLKKYHFDSVDSTSWTTGNRFGFIYKFNGTTLVKIEAPKNHRLSNPRAAALNNFVEYVKFCKYAERYL